jgi:outer membrane protein assembly factor BamB
MATAKPFVFLVFLALGATSALAGEPANWPRWRGPRDNGSIEQGDYPVRFGGTSGLIWKTPLPGKGCSTPIVWNHRIYLTAPVDEQDAVLAFDWSGKPLWKTALGPERKGKHRNGSGCNPSPATDGRDIFLYFKSGTVAAVNLDGKVLWHTNLQERFGKDTLYWDIGSSPALTEQDVVVMVLHHGNSYLAALDKHSGKLDWKVARDYKTAEEGDHSYASPLVIGRGGKEAILVLGGERLTAHDARDGSILWSCAGFNPDAKANWVPVASAVVVGDLAVVPYARGNRLHGIRLHGSGDVTATHRPWMRSDTGSFVPTPAECRGRIYLLRDRGEVECIDPADGKTIWSGALPKTSSNYYASPTVAGGKLYAAREDGRVFVVGIDGRFELLSENDMGERVIASPVPVEGRLLIRGEKNLFCVGKETKEEGGRRKADE